MDPETAAPHHDDRQAREVAAAREAELERWRLAAIVENTDDAIISKDLEGNIRTWNAGAERLFGYRAEEVIGRSIGLLLPPDRPDEEDRILAELRAGRRVDHFETVRRRKDGTVVEVSVTVSPLRDDQGAVVGASKIARDITDRRRAEAALRESEERFRSVLENMSEGVMLFDAGGDLVYQNRASLCIHGFGPDVDGRIARDRLPGTWRAWDEAGRAIAFEEWPVSRVFRGERFEGQVLRVERVETGQVFHGSYNGSPIRDAAGRIALGFITIRDISQQVQAARDARASARRTQAVVEHLPSGLVVADLSTGELHWNAEALRIHGYAGAGAEHRQFEPLAAEHELRTLSGEPLPVHRWPLPRVLAGEEFRDLELRVRNTRLGWERVFSYSGAVVREEGDAPIGLLAVQDVSARTRAEAGLRAANERLVEADRRKDEFLGMLSHELRNPLAPIRNALYLLDRAGPAGRQAQRAQEIATRQVAHLTRLVDDLLDVTRIARGKVELRREELDLAALLRRAAEDYRVLLAERRLALRLELPPGPVPVNGDPARLTQVFGNLLHNAAKFTPAGGRVELTLRREGDRAVAHVADSGPGIPPELLPRLFEPFTQGKQTLARTEGGLRLGLSLVKGLVAMHGGEVAVETGDGGRGGADFAVTLPLAPAAVARRQPRPAAPGAPAPGAARPARGRRPAGGALRLRPARGRGPGPRRRVRSARGQAARPRQPGGAALRMRRCPHRCQRSMAFR